MFKSAAGIAACVAGLVGCSHTTAPRTDFVSGDAVVSRAVECLALTIAGTQYQPVGLPDSLAVVGLHLRVEGSVRRDGVSTCMVPILELSSVARE